jgi:DNA helicase II / ATP-dependent DNA helicase PcrA
MLEGLNAPQREAVTHPGGPLLVIAGAGSGKTRVLTTRIAWLQQERSVWPDRILAFTFTNKAAREMQERVHRLTPAAEGRAWIGTFHATGVRILRREAERIGYDRHFTIYDADDSRTLIKNLLADLKADPKQLSPRAVASEISRHKNNFLSPEQVLVQALTPRDEKVAEVYAAYVKRLKETRAMDFDDLIGRTVELFERHRDVQQRYAERFEHVLVDEFQDTNPLQLVMIRALCAVHDNLCAVGDDDQSIYSWRGATVDNMLGFEEYFRGASVVRLEQNYRSTSVILRAANEVIAHNRRRKGKNLWTERAGGALVEIWWAEDEEDEAARVRDRIRALLAESDARRGDIVILYRTNAQSRVLEDALRREGLPYQIIGGTRFYERREVRDVLAYLKVIQNPADRIALARVLNVPKRGIGKTTAERLFEVFDARGGSALDVLRDRNALASVCGNAPAKRLFAFGQLLDQLTRLAERADVAGVLRQLLETVQYESYLREDDPATADERLSNVGELLNAAHEFASESDDKSLGAFLESVALLADSDRMQDTEDLITMMTVHTAKGLEFPYVFVAGCEENLLPHVSSLEADDGLEEERRLFYVALTRAEEQVFLTSAAARRRFGVLESAVPSRFLHEIPEDCRVEFGEQFQERRTNWAARESNRDWSSVLAPGSRGENAPRARRPRPVNVAGPDPMADARAFLQSRAKRIGTRERRADHGFDEHDLVQEDVSYCRGQRVHHELLGEGVVEEVEGHGDLLRLTIRFGEHGRKRILARYARLHALGEDAQT